MSAAVQGQESGMLSKYWLSKLNVAENLFQKQDYDLKSKITASMQHAEIHTKLAEVEEAEAPIVGLSFLTRLVLKCYFNDVQTVCVFHGKICPRKRASHLGYFPNRVLDKVPAPSRREVETAYIGLLWVLSCPEMLCFHFPSPLNYREMNLNLLPNVACSMQMCTSESMALNCGPKSKEREKAMMQEGLLGRVFVSK